MFQIYKKNVFFRIFGLDHSQTARNVFYRLGVLYADGPMHRLPNQLQKLAEIEHFLFCRGSTPAQTKARVQGAGPEKSHFSSKIEQNQAKLAKNTENSSLHGGYTSI